jgi:hypothetical protein
MILTINGNNYNGFVIVPNDIRKYLLAVRLELKCKYKRKNNVYLYDGERKWILISTTHLPKWEKLQSNDKYETMHSILYLIHRRIGISLLEYKRDMCNNVMA